MTKFVGRGCERALFRKALQGVGARAFYIYGPGGVGKTTLLQMFATDAHRRSIRIEQIDCRNHEPTLRSVMDDIERAGLSASHGDIESPPQRVVMIDSYEHVHAIESRICSELLRRLRGDTLLVIAGRMPPSVEWRSQPQWHSGIIPIALRNLNPIDAKTLLVRRGIRDEATTTILAFSHGHPLALALAADACRNTPDRPFAPESAPHVIAALYDYFLRGISEPERRVALDITSVLRTTSEQSLCTMLERDASGTFAWLRQLSFMQIDNRGIFPHDLAREVILADMRWRNRERLSTMIKRAMNHYLEYWRTRPGNELIHALPEFYFLSGHYPQINFMRVPPDIDLAMDDLRPGDERALQAAVQRHEGPTSLRHLRHWLLHQPAAFKVVRRANDSVAGFGAWIRLDLTTNEQRAADPAVALSWEYANRLTGSMGDKPIHCVRFITSCTTGQRLSPEVSLCMQNTGKHMLRNWGPLLFFCMYERRSWDGIWTVSDTHVVPELQHETDGMKREILVQDLRGLSFADVLVSVINRCTMGEYQEHDSIPTKFDDSSRAAVSLEEFGSHVREALRTFHDILELSSNPLAHSHIMRSKMTPEANARERAHTLQSLIVNAAEAIRGTPRGDSLHRVLESAYLKPSGKHESAAEELGMSYSTFRRRLSAATKYVVATLWELELSCTSKA